MLVILSFLKNVGPKFVALVALALVVYLSVTWIKEDTKTDFLKDQKIEQIQTEIDIRKRVNKILEQNREANPDRDGSIALDRLRQRYDND